MDEPKIDLEVSQYPEQGSQLVPFGTGAADDGDDGEGHGEEIAPLTEVEQEALVRQIYRETFTALAVREAPTLVQWQRVMAAWLATVPSTPSIPACVTYARHLTRYRISKDAIVELLARSDFQRLTEQMRASEQTRLRELANVDYRFYLDAHKKGLQMALDAGDHRGVPAYTTPMLDRALPKKEEHQEKAPMVVINIEGSAGKLVEARVLSTEEIPVAEVLEVTADEPQ